MTVISCMLESPQIWAVVKTHRIFYRLLAWLVEALKRWVVGGRLCPLPGRNLVSVGHYFRPQGCSFFLG